MSPFCELFDHSELATSRPLVHEGEIFSLPVYVTSIQKLFLTDEMYSGSLFFFPKVKLSTVHTTIKPHSTLFLLF